MPRPVPQFRVNPQIDDQARGILGKEWAVLIGPHLSVDAKPLARELLERGLEIDELRRQLALALCEPAGVAR